MNAALMVGANFGPLRRKLSSAPHSARVMIAGMGALIVLAATVLIGPESDPSTAGSGSGIDASDLIVGESSRTIDG